MVADVVGEFVKETALLPWWWYTRGALHVVHTTERAFLKTWHSFGVSVWLRNIFVPMFGQYDWQSRLISLLVRVAQIVVRSIGFGIMALLILLRAVVYIALPVVIVMLIILGLTASY